MTGQVRVRVIPSTSWMRETTLRPRSSSESASASRLAGISESASAARAESGPVPDFASAEHGWQSNVADWQDPPSLQGHGPIKPDPAHPFNSNANALRTNTQFVDRNKKFARVVYQVVDGKAVTVPVSIGPSDLTHTVIVGGLEPGQTIVTGPYKSLLSLKDGRVLAGMVTAKNDRTLTLRTMTDVQTVERSEIAKVEESPRSMMPEGLLAVFTPEQRRNLFAYLMGHQQVELPAAK